MVKTRFLTASFAIVAAFAAAIPAIADGTAAFPLSLDATRFLPAPPQAGSAAQVADATAVHARYSTERVEQARRDNEVDPFSAFAPVLGPGFTAQSLPATQRLLTGVRDALVPAMIAAKARWNRPRPFVVEPELPVCAPVREKLRTSGSYPSGHSASGWAWALVLAQLRPDQAEAILQRGREFGESRVICGVHWPSDVEAGRMLGSATVALLHDQEGFRTMMQSARTELTVTTANASPSDTSPSNGAARKLDALLWEGVAKGIPGISAAVATRNGIVWTGTAGVADVNTGEAIRPDMLFGVGSITKTFAAVVILQLAQEKRLNLHATAASILGSAVDGIPNANKATLAQLLNHTGGVPSWEDDPKWIRDGRGATLDVDRIWGKPDTLAYIKGHEPLAPAGLSFSYANTNYTLLGMVIEKVTGHEAVREIHERILEPLGLKDIHLEGFEREPHERLPHRYHWATAEFQADAGVNAAFAQVRPELIDASRSNLSVEWTAGGMVATARDLALYAVALRDGKLLNPQSMRFLKEWFPAAEGRQIGHNVFRDSRSGVPVIGHAGDVLGFTGSFYWLESGDTVVAMMCNVGSMHSGKVPATAYTVSKDRRFIDAAQELARESPAPQSHP